MDDKIQNKLDALGLYSPKQLQLSSNVKTPPTWIRIRGNKAYISGHGPQNPDGSIARPFGKVVGSPKLPSTSSSKELTIEQAYQSAKLASLSILGSLKRNLGNLDKVTAWLQVRVMINTVSGFTQTTYVADGFSDLIIKLYGSERGLHARSAIGVQALPLDLPVIIDALVEIEHNDIQDDIKFKNPERHKAKLLEMIQGEHMDKDENKNG
jgi:enamine deaminase RidA (YjgF/YER057c/UK114 family)